GGGDPRGFHAERAGGRLGHARGRHLRGQPRRGRTDPRRQDARSSPPDARPSPARPRRMSESGALLPTLDRLFAGPRDSVLTLEDFLRGLETRSYALAIAAFDVINCLPTGIPWLSTITRVPLFLLAI